MPIERAVYDSIAWDVLWTAPGTRTTVFGAPIASFTASQDFPGAPVQFDASASFETGATITSYTWDFGDGSTTRKTSSPQISRSYVKVGSYSVILVVADAAGNRAQTEQTVSVAVDKVPIPAFTADVSLYNVAVDASDSTDPDGAIVAYDWDWGDGGVGSGVTTNHTYEFSGEYEVTLILTDNQGIRASASQTIVAAPLPDAEFLINANALVVTVNAQESIDFNPITQYTWYWGETGTANSYGITATHTYRAAGTYPIALQITDAAGNTDVVTHEVSVSPIIVPEPPRASFTFVTTDLKASFNASSSSSSDSTITGYSWNFGDGHTGSGVTASHTYSDGGAYPVELTVTDLVGLAGRKTRSVTVSPAFHSQTLEGFDASYNKPTGAQAAAAGRKACVLYITDPGSGNKGITQSVFNDYNSHGVAIAFVWEEGASAVLNGHSQGVSDAQRAQANLTALDGPSNQRPLYFAIDFDIQPSDYAAAKAYFQGVNSVIGENRTGAYGHYDILSYLTQQKVISKRWQTYAWSGGSIYSPLDIYQYSNNNTLGSGTVDYDRMYSDNWGQKAVDSPVTTPKETLTWPYQDMNRRQVIADDDYDPDESWQHHRDRGSLGGVDHNCPYGTPLYANAAGRVYTTSLANGGSGGRTLSLYMGNSGWYDQFMHLSSFAVSDGQTVKQGQLVGHSGASGYGTDYYYAPHFHLHRYTPGGTRVNAWHYFNGGGTGDSRNVPPGPIIVTLQTGVPNQMFWRKLQWFAKGHGYTYPCDGYMSIPAWKGVQRGMVSHGYTGAIDGVPGKNLYRAMQAVAHAHGSTSPIDGTLSTADYRALSAWLNG